MKLTIREANGSSKVVELAKDLEIVAKKGQQFIFSNGFSSYSMNFKDDQKSVEFLFKIDGKSIKVSLNGIVPFLNENQADIENPTLVLINKDLNDQDIKSIIENNAFNGSEIIDKLESLIASKTNNTALVTDFQSLVETLEAAAAGGEGQGTARTSGVKVGSSDALSDSLFGLQETDKWINLERGISSLPVETGGIVAPVEVENIPEATITPKYPKDPTPEVPVDPTDPTKPLDPKDPSLGTKGAVAVEGEDLVFTVKVTQSVNPETYDFVIKDGTAEAGKDFTTNNVSFTNGVTYDPTTGKITVPAGVTEFEVVVKTIDDKIIENTESLTVTVGTSTAVGYIIDNDKEDITVDPDPDPKDPTDPKDLGSKGATVTEGDTAEFKVSLTESSKDQTVTITLTGATAEKGKDFLNPSETQDIVIKYADGTSVTVSPNTDGTYSVNVPAGETNFVVEVKTFDDELIENTEDYTLTVKVGNAEKTVSGTILDNDKPEATITPKDPKDPTPEVPVDPTDPTKPLDPKDPSLGTKGAVAVEGEDLVFTVKVTQSVNPETYDFVIKDGTAEAGKDFTTNNVSFTNGVTYDPTTGKITVPAGVTEFEVVVKTIDDKIIENTESLTVTVGTSTAVGYIIDNDFKLADEDSFKTNEDTPHTLKIDDFGVGTNSSVTEVKITELPTNGQLTLNGVVVGKDQVITRADIDSGKLVFTPNANTDEDGSFKFLVNDGSKWANIESTTTIEVIAVADKPTTSIDVVKQASGEYSVKIDAALTDTDGSETLTVKISNVPNGAVLTSTKYEVTKNTDGTWNVKVPAGDKSIADTLVMKNVPAGTNWVDLKITATATEKNDNTDGKNFATSESSDATVYGVGESNQVCIAPEKFNILLTIDMSSSMSKNNAVQNTKDALTNLINTYGKLGEVKVALNVFANNSSIKTNASGKVWMTIEEAQAIIDSLDYVKNGTTNYDDAMLKSMEILSKNELPYTDGKTVSYFISDGSPNEGMKLNANGEYISRTDFPWTGKEINPDILNNYKTNYLDKVDSSYSIGILGQGTFNTTFLNNMGENVHLAQNVTKLTDELLATIKTTLVEGDVSDNIVGGDGAVTIDSIKFENSVYTKANMPKDGILSSDGKIKLVFDFETGKYKFIAVNTDFVVKNAIFEVNASDSNGDTTKFDVGLTVSGVPLIKTPNVFIDVERIETTDYSGTGLDDGNLVWNEITKATVTGSQTSGATNDKVTIDKLTGSIFSGAGDDRVVVKDSTGSINTDLGNDVVIVGVNKGSINTGSGDDIIAVHNATSGSIDGGMDYDTLHLAGKQSDYEISRTYNGTKISYDTYNTEVNGVNLNKGVSYYFKNKVTGEEFSITNIENIVFESMGPVKKLVSYEVDFKASLQDLNGSETLTVKITNVPNGATFDLPNMKNLGNGVWEVIVPAGAKSIDYKNVKMTVPEGTKYVDLTIEAKAEINTTCGIHHSKEAEASDATVFVSSENIAVYEKGLANGTKAGDGSNIAKGAFTLAAVDGIATIKIGDTNINVSDLLAGKNIPTITVPNGELKITGYDNGKVNYEYTLTKAHNHDKSKGEDLVANKDIQVVVTDKNGDSNSGKINVSIHDDTPRTSIDDSQAGGQILVVPVAKVDVGNIKAEFSSWKGGNSYTNTTNTDTIPGKDTLKWGDSNAKSSGYDFKGNTTYNGISEDVINTQLNLGTFTHTNKPITAGTAISEATLRVELDVVIDGKSVHIVHDIVIDHNETSNSGTAEQNRDIVTIKDSSFSQTINVGGKAYLFVIDGFLDKNGQIVKQVKTWEDGEQPYGQVNFNSFDLFASIVSTDPLPKIEGNAYGDDAGSNAIFGADGAAKNNAIVWQNGVVQADGTTKIVGTYGTLTVDKNGHYEFELNRATYDNLKATDDKTATFKYTVTDADGDTRESLVNIKLNGAIYENADNIGRTIEGSNADDIIFGSSGNDYIYGGAGNDTITAGAGRDVIYGGAGNDTINTDLSTKNGQAYGDVHIDGGTGYDKIVLSGNDDIDLSVIRGKVAIKNIEEIDLTAGNHAIKNLKLQDVLDMTDGKNELLIKGNYGDRVQLDLNEWTSQSNGKGQTEYVGKGANSTVKLIIDDQIDISNI